MITIWRGGDGDIEPVEMHCEVFGWPNKTDSGETMFENTHFRTKEDAWKSIFESASAGIRLISRDIQELDSKRVELSEQLYKEARRYSRATDNFKRQ